MTISEDIHDLLPLLNQLLLLTAACILVAIVFPRPLLSSSKTKVHVARHSARSGGGGDDQEYTITKCPSPNCARCSRYAELNRSAQRRLPYVARGHALQRIRCAITAGPNVVRDDDDAESLSPVLGQRPNVLLVRGLTAHPFVTQLHQDACRILKILGRNVVLNEYIVAMTSPSARALENDVNRGAWQVLHLMNQGEWINSNVSLCPKTMDALRSFGEGSIMEGCIFGNVFISVLHPGTIIDPHCGPSNVRHRLHFSLQVPNAREGDEAPHLCVAREKTIWREGECFVFDDSIVHSVAFGEDVISSEQTSKRDVGTGNCRVVLIVDLWHPDLTREERRALSDLYPSARCSIDL